MNIRLLQAALKAPKGQRAKLVSRADCDRLEAALGDTVAPWYLELLQIAPLAGNVYEYTGRPARTQVSWRIEWLDADGILKESTELYPGIVARRSGYVAVGACCTGSGDPFFLRFDSDDPPLLQIFHDAVSDDGGLGRNAMWTVAPCLAEFFMRVRAPA